MRSDEKLSGLIGNIYDAALSPSLWPAALQNTATFVGGTAGGLYVRDAVHRTGNIQYEFGTDPRHTRLYFETYIKCDPLNAAYPSIEVGDVYSSSTFIPYAELIKTRFYQEWVRPQGWIDNVCVTLEKSATRHASLAVFRNGRDGPADENARLRLRLLVPHIRRAVSIGKVIEMKATEAETLAGTLDGISAGLFLLDAHARIVHANAAGSAMLAGISPFRNSGGKLAANDARADQALHKALFDAGGGAPALSQGCRTTPLAARDGTRFVAHLLPLVWGALRRAGATYGAVAALFVHKATLGAHLPQEAVARTYRLTPAEVRVMLAVVDGGGVPEVAAALGITEGTIKTHLRHLFEKTGARRQADLVKIVAEFSSPLVG